MNFETIKTGFLSYLEEKLNKTEGVKSGETNDYSLNKVISDSEISIFLYSNDFKNYLVDEVGADSSIFSKSVNEIMEMDFVNGKLVDPSENNSDSFETDQASLLSAEEINMSQEIAPDGMPYDEITIEEGNSAAGLMQDTLNMAFENSAVISALDTDKTGSLNKDEVNAFFDSVKASNENGEITFDGVADAIRNIINPEEANQGEEEKADPITEILNAIYDNGTAVKALDIDGDGKLSDEEKAKFEQYVKDNFSQDGELTLQSLKDAFSSIIDGNFSYEKTKDDINNDKASIKAAEKPEASNASSLEGNNTGSVGNASSGNGAGSVSGGGGSGSVSGGGGSNFGGSSNIGSSSSQAPKGKTLEELEREKTTKEGEVSEAREAVNEVYSGDNAEVKSAKEAEENAKKEYDEAVKNDEKISDELKQKREKNLEDIATKEKEIDDKNIEINNKDTEISNLNTDLHSAESEVSALEAALKTYDSAKSDDPEKQQELAAKKQQVEADLQAAKEKVEQIKQQIKEAEEQKKTLEENLNTLKSDLEKLNTTKSEIEKEITANCEPETKQAMDEYNKAKENTETVKETQAEKAKGEVDTKQKELDEINEQIDEKKAEETKSENSASEFDMSGIELNLSSMQEEDLERFKQNWEENKEKYEEVEKATGMPAELIAAIHWREGSGDFTTYLHNGEKLGQVTTLEPAGVYFTDWTEAAIDAINREKGNATMANDGSLEYYLNYAEGYNGWGYKNKGVVSPYVWAGTTNYHGGKYVADGVYDPNHYDQQLGVAAMMKAIMS